MRCASPSTIAVLPTPADLLVAADHRIELALARLLGEVPGEALECLILRFGLLVGYAMRPAHALQRGEQLGASHLGGRKQLAGRRTLLVREREQQMLGRDVGVAQRLGVLVGAVEHAGQLARHRGLGDRARLLGEPLHLARRLSLELGDVEPGLLEQRDDDALFLVQQDVEEMRVVHHGVAAGPRERRRLL